VQIDLDLREQHIHPTTTLQKEDGEERSTKTTFVSDVARSGWSTFLIDKTITSRGK
jgi:hypothetical protein